MPIEKVLITVKTYPTLSSKYDELVCTAGFREDGSWVRIYPVEFRKKPYSQQYSKYNWIETDLVKNTKDFRKESFRPKTAETEIRIVGEIKADGGSWKDRRDIVLKNVYTSMNKLISEAKDKKIGTSLAVFKPRSFDRFIIEEETREWDQKYLDSLKQYNLFEDTNGGKFEVVKKLPYKFSYQFTDEEGYCPKLMIEDWEIGQLFWNSLKSNDGNERKAVMDVEKKYFDDFAKTKDLYLFLGTTLKFHNMAPNPFVIIGTFHPKAIKQLSIF